MKKRLIKTIYLLEILISLISFYSCTNIYQSKEYIDLNNQFDILKKKYHQISAVSKEELLKKIEVLESNNQNQKLELNRKSETISKLESSIEGLLIKLNNNEENLKKTQKSFRNYIVSKQRSDISEVYLIKQGWKQVSLSIVQELKNRSYYKEVVFVKFTSGLGLNDGWYELGIMASSYNIPRFTYAKKEIMSIKIIGSDGSELKLDECYDCRSR